MNEEKCKHEHAYCFHENAPAYCPECKNYIDGNIISFKNEIDISEAKDCVGDSEIYCDFYKCSNCNNNQVRLYDVYCSTCGCKFNWKE